jgi:hypothetical protein
MSNRFVTFAAVCVLCAFVRVPSAGAQTTTALFFHSETGDWIGGGMGERTWFDTELTFAPLSWTTRSHVSIRADNFASGGSTWWDLTFASPEGSELAPGLYEYAADAYSKSPLRSGLNIGGSGRGCTGSGRFVVYEIAFDSAGTLVRFAADFEQHCDGRTPALFGAIRFHSTRSSLTPFDGAYPVYALHVDPSPFGRVSGGGFDCGNGGTTCDVQYGTAATVTLTATPAPGYQFLAWSGDCAGKLAQAAVVASTRKWCTPVFDAVPGSGMPPPFGGGTLLFVDRQAVSWRGADRWVMQPSDAVFKANGSPDRSYVRIDVTAYDGDLWEVAFRARDGETLAPGVYERATSATWHAPMTPGFEIRQGGGDCVQILARFVIYELAFDSSGKPTRLSADFEQHCAGGDAGGTFGAIRYNATRSAVVPFDGAYPVYSLTIDPPLNGTVSGAGIYCGEGGTGDCEETYGASGSVTVTAVPAPGHVFVAWTGDCKGSTTARVTVITRHRCGAVFDNAPDATGPLADDLRSGSLFFFSQRGDYIGLGVRQLWTRTDTQFLAGPAYSTTPSRWVDVWIKTPDGDSWSLDFAAPLGQSLRVGDYDGATRFPFQADTRPGLDVSGHGRGCNTLTGRFRVYEVQFDGAGKVISFAADFEQHCEGGASALFGAIRYNSTRASVLPFDGNFLPRPDMSLDTPGNGSTVFAGGPFTIAGWALNRGEQSGTGIDTVHVYAFPEAGGGPIFLGVATYGVARADLGAIYGTQFTNSGYQLTAGESLAPGRYLIAAYGRDTITGTFDVVRMATITVAPPVSVPQMAIDVPGDGSHLAGSFLVAGWAFDAAAPSGTGVDAVHVWAVPVSGAAPLFVGVATLDVLRPDVGAIYGVRFTNSGFYVVSAPLPPGAYTIVVGAHSTATGTFNQMKTVSIIVP